MIIELLTTGYTQVNTSDAKYLVQNLGDCNIGLVAASSLPAITVQADIVLRPLEAISDQNFGGIFYAKSLSKMPVGKEQVSFVGVTE